MFDTENNNNSNINKNGDDKMKTRTILLTMLLISTSLFAQSQNNWSFEFRSGASYATKDLGDADLGIGLGYEITISYRFMPHLAAYGGWGWHQFSADQSFAGSDLDFEETGYTFGLQFIHPIGDSRLNYLVRAGGIYNHIEIENNEGDIIIDSGHGLGWQVEAGLEFKISQQLRLLPSIRYRSLTRDIETSNGNMSVDLNYLSAGLGLNWAF